MNRSSRIKKFARGKSFTLLLVLVVVIILFQLLNKNFLSADNIRNILIAASLSGTLAVGIGCLLIAGNTGPVSRRRRLHGWAYYGRAPEYRSRLGPVAAHRLRLRSSRRKHKRHILHKVQHDAVYIDAGHGFRLERPQQYRDRWPEYCCFESGFS